jgi:hypothetical protein
MRILAPLILLVLVGAPLSAQDTTRHGIEPDLKSYPQSTPQEALASVLKAIEANRVDYLVAQLADPIYIDERVKRLYGGNFAEQVIDSTGRLDVGVVRMLKQLAKEGEWKVAANEAHLGAKAIVNRGVYMRKLGNRWYLENTQSP